MLVSDPIQCQEGDSELSFRYWTSPRTSIRVCTRDTTTIKNFNWCSSDISKGDPGPAVITIPGSIMFDFEIVIEAQSCLVPHVDPPIPLPDKTCALLNCEFDSDQTECVERLSGSNWRRSEEPTGNLHSGIRSLKSGAFAFFKGQLKGDNKSDTEEPDNELHARKTRNVLNEMSDPNESNFLAAFPESNEVNETENLKLNDEKLQKLIESEEAKIEENTAARLHFEDFELPRQLILEFCIYMTSEGSRFAIESELKGYCRSTLVEFGQQIGLEPHRWLCYRLILHAGFYNALDFVVYHNQMKSPYSYVGLDGLKLYELNGLCACPSLCSMDSNPTTMLNTSNPYSAGCNPYANYSSNYVQQPYTLPTLVQSPQLDIDTGKFKDDTQFIATTEDSLSEVEKQKPSLSIKITKSKSTTTSNNFPLPADIFKPNQQTDQIPPSFAISVDDSQAPIAQPTPSISFGGLNDNLRAINLSSELEKLKRPRRKWIKF
ncbi:hypothetical protein M3Y97_00171300 [Aphelenchoides bicaudatus]|nr:hypothetical protein M3Y97_00171300 [Aphelenchoides bicaudatus]